MKSLIGTLLTVFSRKPERRWTRIVERGAVAEGPETHYTKMTMTAWQARTP
jgi:hypothetical protein